MQRRSTGNDEANVKARKTLEELLKIFPAETTQILEYFLGRFAVLSMEERKRQSVGSRRGEAWQGHLLLRLLGRRRNYDVFGLYGRRMAGKIRGTGISGSTEKRWMSFLSGKNGKPWQNCITAASMGSAGDEANSLTGRYDTIEKTFR